MRSMLLATLLLISTSSWAASIVGTWESISGPAGVMVYHKTGKVELKPKGAIPLVGTYVLTGNFVEIRPAGGRKPSTVYVRFSGNDTLYMRYETGESQAFKRIE